MSEDSAHGRKHQFLSKSKWGKVFKPADDHKTSESKQNYKLNEDVVDFLKPSTEKYSGLGTGARTTPKIDTASALRWPDAATVKGQVASNQTNTVPSPIPAVTNGKSRRRKGLAVRFVTAAPEIIGHGGGETETPSIEISQRRRAQPTQRSVSDSRPTVPRHADASLAANQYARPGRLERAQTDYGYEPQGEPRRDESLSDRNNPEGQSVVPRPGMMRRAPTGMVTEEELGNRSPVFDSPEMPFLDGAFPSIHIQKIPNRSMHTGTGFADTDGRDMGAQTRVKKQMRAEEGRAFSTAWRLSQQGLSLAENAGVPGSTSNVRSHQQSFDEPKLPSILVDEQTEVGVKAPYTHRSNRSCLLYTSPSPRD